jgi:hypothetical protein
MFSSEMGDDDFQLGGWQSPLALEATVGRQVAASQMCSANAIRERVPDV